MRVAVGQAVALLFDLVREVDEALLDSKDSDSAYELIQGLATESDRHTARKDRNHQRATFKDILNTLEVHAQTALPVIQHCSVAYRVTPDIKMLLRLV